MPKIGPAHKVRGTLAPMFERRQKRSTDRVEALQLLVETVADRSRVRALILADDAGRIMAGMGPAHDLKGLARTGRDVAWRRASATDVDSTSRGADVTARSIATRDGMLYLAALGDHVAGVGDAVRAVQRILSETAAR